MKLGIRNFSSKNGSEAELVDAALEKGLPFGEGIAVVLREPKMPTGFPDIVAVFADAKADSFTLNRRKLTQQHFRLLYHLHNSGRSNVDDVAKLLLLPRKHVAELIDDLFNADLISTRGNFVTARPLEKIFAARQIIAVEAKIKNWRKALQQAVANLWFASHSYILLPPLRTLSHVVKEAKTFGVGVLVFDGKKTKMVFRPKRQQIPISYGSWLISEWALF